MNAKTHTAPLSDRELMLLDVAVERTAQRLLELLQAHSSALLAPVGLVDAATVAEALGMTPQAVRRKAEQLGGRRVGEKGRWRFDLAEALKAGCSASNTTTASQSQKSKVKSKRKRSTANRLPQPGAILGVQPR